MSSSSSIPCEDPQQEQDKDCTLQEDNDALEETLLERMGGWRGVVYSTLPVVVFVPVNAWKGLMPALWLSLIHISEPTRLIIRSRMPSSA